MSRCRHMRQRIAEALYGELSEDRRRELDAHLRSCRDCARLYQQMAATLDVMNARQATEPDEAFWTGYSERLAERFESQQQRQTLPRPGSFLEHLARYRHAAWRAGAVAALVLVGVFLGRWIWTREPPGGSVRQAAVPPSHRADPAEAVMEDRAQEYLQRSKVLLLALANFDPGTDDTMTLNLQSQRRISASLVQEAEYLKTALADPAQMRLRELVGDLEVILLQIANLEDEHDLEAVEMLQRGVNKQEVLLRIDLSKILRRSPGRPSSQNQGRKIRT